MSKKYDFRLVLRQAIFDGPYAQIVFGASSTAYAEVCFEGSLKEAVAKLEQISQQESRPHAGSISMKYRDDRKPAGFNKLPGFVFGGEGAKS